MINHFDTENYRLSVYYRAADSDWHWRLEEYVDGEWVGKSMIDGRPHFHGVKAAGVSCTRRGAIRRGKRKLKKICKIIESAEAHEGTSIVINSNEVM